MTASHWLVKIRPTEQFQFVAYAHVRSYTTCNSFMSELRKWAVQPVICFTFHLFAALWPRKPHCFLFGQVISVFQETRQLSQTSYKLSNYYLPILVSYIIFVFVFCSRVSVWLSVFHHVRFVLPYTWCLLSNLVCLLLFEQALKLAST